MKKYVLLVGVSVALLALAGCGSSTAEISGKVTYQGQAVSGGSVIIFGQNNQMAAGLIGPDGAYHIPNVPRGPVQVTVRSHPKTPPGFHMKQVIPHSPDAPTQAAPTSKGRTGDHRPIPEKYNQPDRSGLSLVVNQSSQVFDIDLQ